MSLSRVNINHFWADLIVDELVRNGVRHFFVAPGSRSTPLVAAISRHPEARATIHFDERGSAFMALGFARGSGQAAVWVTTSGTAVANGLPAIVEAAQSGIPLIALTSDRPPELSATGANQAIDQTRVFGTYPRWFVDLPCPAVAIDPAFLLTTIDQAVHRALDTPAGPVHINCRFREPLAPSDDQVELPSVPPRWEVNRIPYTDYRTAELHPDRGTMGEVLEHVSSARRGLIVVGQLNTHRDGEAILDLASQLGWPVVADVTSQLRLGQAHECVVAHPHFVVSAMAHGPAPDHIMRFGGPISSKAIQQYVDSSLATVVAINENPDRRDPGHRVARVIRSSARTFCRDLQDGAFNGNRPWLAGWMRAGQNVQSYFDKVFTEQDDISEPAVAALVTRRLPSDHVLFAASSMPIRDLDMFGAAEGGLRSVSSNRGASGIDGTVSTALGYHLGSQKPLVLVIGDLALLHDLNSLASIADRRITIVVVNNGGGGIFHFLPIADHKDLLDPWFSAPHAWKFEHAAAMFGLNYQYAGSIREFDQSFSTSVSSDGASIIEVSTDRFSNREIHDGLKTGAVAAAQRNLSVS